MFFHRRADSDLTSRLVDDLLDAQPSRREAILDRAVRHGDLRRAEADELLRLVNRLDSVLRAEVPSSGASLPRYAA